MKIASQWSGARQSRPRERVTKPNDTRDEEDREKVDFTGLKASALFAMPLTMSPMTFMRCG